MISGQVLDFDAGDSQNFDEESEIRPLFVARNDRFGQAPVVVGLTRSANGNENACCPVRLWGSSCRMDESNQKERHLERPMLHSPALYLRGTTESRIFETSVCQGLHEEAEESRRIAVKSGPFNNSASMQEMPV